jgi:hypothetical protein
MYAAGRNLTSAHPQEMAPVSLEGLRGMQHDEKRVFVSHNKRKKEIAFLTIYVFTTTILSALILFGPKNVSIFIRVANVIILANIPSIIRPLKYKEIRTETNSGRCEIYAHQDLLARIDVSSMSYSSFGQGGLRLKFAPTMSLKHRLKLASLFLHFVGLCLSSRFAQWLVPFHRRCRSPFCGGLSDSQSRSTLHGSIKLQDLLMSTKPKWAELSDVQRQSWSLVGPFLAAHLIVNILLLAAYSLGLTGAVAGNGACLVIEALNSGVTDLHRARGTAESLDRICQLYVPASLVNIIFAAILGGIITLSRGMRILGSRYFLPLFVFAFVPLILLTLNPSSSMTSSLARSLRSGSWTAYVVLLVSVPFITGMLAALLLQKDKGRRTHVYGS